MAKLNTTVDNIELKSNKITNAAKPLASWTDTQYPSAKTLYNAYNALLDTVHPVGSLMITSTNVDPSSTVGGTWGLVDKSLKDTYTTITTDHWTSTNATVASYSNIMLTDHAASIRLHLKLTKAIAASELSGSSLVALGKLDLPTLGLVNLSYSIYDGVAFSEDGQCTVCYKADTNGTISITDVIKADDTHTIANNSTFYIYITQPINVGSMQEEFCDKFYWKRNA